MDATFEEEAEQAVTLNEYLEEVEERELEVDLVLGGDDGKECTYGKGYLKRQAIFSCLTCTPDGNAGVCTACSLSCHDGHQIVELWTKRNFRCDCGNSKFGEFYCKILPNKDVENTENSYNHNFKGSYCTCGRPYPDPDVEEQVEMLQCCLCEDWFHEEHLGLESSDEIPRDEEGEPLYEDFICKPCSEVCFFLNLYPKSIWAVGKQLDATVEVSKDKGVLEDKPSTGKSEEPMGDTSNNSPKVVDAKVDSESVSGGQSMLQGGNCDGSLDLNQCPESTSNGKSMLQVGDCNDGLDLKLNLNRGTENISGGKSMLHGGKCIDSLDLNQCAEGSDMKVDCLLGVDIAAASPILPSKAMFLSKNWRDALCKCNKCMEFYRQKRITFLIDKEDSIAEYERVAKQKREANIEQQQGAELSFFNKLGHVEKVEILKGIQEMKDGLRSFLESADTSKPITADDVHQLFDNIKKKRRRDV
ncbi:hypothetical protein HN51_007708 [Arachis hypogaea]|uniref:UBR-type domain-containing protein n=2 Tax=Arachis TaxID=3817 RepID=A0A445D6G6_ARAHY|nr:uncharacterized protein LOC107488401 [Arachis duranensis]XP_025699908.1 putative E3 ubiquitin-protein ligase UBR7 [Arachis hypogaea]QHO41897.1 Putative E3 ubiquitin-protein ligase [Arachis hypogaea]RYR58851.1 hypothetical protein Ahy_A05g024719 isoform A [Arachis hypogaea]RYR58852.1 hypothetical protein Ahy_A05g024719 isoform B [Arachis hypogaea]